MLRWCNENLGGPEEMEEDIKLSQLIIEKTQSTRIYPTNEQPEPEGNLPGQP
jgi:hypothetical protein